MITLIGLGSGDADSLSRGAERALREASEQHVAGTGRLLLRTARHPVVPALNAWGLVYESLDTLYDSLPDFESVYAAIADRVLATARPVAFAVPGHPLFAEDSVRRIRERATTENIPVRLIASGSFVEATLTAVGADLGDGCDVRDALSLLTAPDVAPIGHRLSGRPDVTRGLLLYQVYDPASASHAKLALMRDYPDDHPVVLVRWAGVVGREEVRPIPLFRLDREPVDHLTSVYVPPLPPEQRRPDFETLAGVMARLRAPDGCPWDREQTHASLKKYFVEETYEVLEAIDANDPDLLCEELGDALLQVVFHAQLAAEEGVFTADDVCARIVEKLVRRHPHVFGEVQVTGSDEVLQNWEQIKRAEKAETDPNWRPSLLDGVPKDLPALMRAMEISKRVVKVGFEWAQFADVLAKLDEELAELKAELNAPIPNRDAVFAELGDLLFTLVQVARWQKLDPEEALRQMLRRFTARFQHIEAGARAQNRDLASLSLAEMDALWNEAKAQGK